MDDVGHFAYRGARALTILHEHRLRSFVDLWYRAKATGVNLPKTDHRAYRSLDTLLGHVLGAARGYMTWICEKLELPDPSIQSMPEDVELEALGRDYLEHLVERWRLPLLDIHESRFEDRVYDSRWGVPHSIEAMLEHAVMHPIRHQFQLEELMAAQA